MINTSRWDYVPNNVGWALNERRREVPSERRPCWTWRLGQWSERDPEVAVVAFSPGEYWLCGYGFDPDSGDTIVVEKHTNLEAALVSATLTNLEV